LWRARATESVLPRSKHALSQRIGDVIERSLRAKAAWSTAAAIRHDRRPA